MDLSGVNEPRDFDDLRALEFDLGQVLGRHDHVLFRLELIAFDDFLRRQRLAAFLAFFLVTDRAVVVLVQLIEADVFLGIHRIVNADGNGHERELNVPFPDGSHASPPVESSSTETGTTDSGSPTFTSMFAFIGCSQDERCPDWIDNSRLECKFAAAGGGGAAFRLKGTLPPPQLLE